MRSSRAYNSRMKQTVYFVPFSEEGLENKLFAPYSDPNANVPPFPFLKEYLSARGYDVSTIDFWKPEEHRPDNILIVFDHPPTGYFKWAYKIKNAISGKSNFPIKNEKLGGILNKFSKKILFLWESPANTPWMYRDLEKIKKLYDAVYSVLKIEGTSRFYYPQIFDSWNREYFDRTRNKFMVLINGPHRAKGYFKYELYSERVRALKYFVGFNEVDVYGKGWETSKDSAIRKNAKGWAKNKNEIMSRYAFALCFENATWPGYVTEKIFDCMLVGTIPIYWGAPDIEEYVPADCFIDMRKFITRGTRVNYGELRTFLHALTPREIQGYKEAMRAYFESASFKKFTPEYFAETVLKIIAGSPEWE